MVAHDVAFLSCCCFCDTFFVTVIRQVDLAGFSGKKAKAALDDQYDKWQRQIPVFQSLRCPTCVEMVNGMSYQEWISNLELECPLSVSRVVQFDADADPLPPLYINTAAFDKKPKWKLCSGIGPPSLEVDKSRSGRIFKPSLRQFGVGDFKTPIDTLSQDEYKYIHTAVGNYLGCNCSDDAQYAAACQFLNHHKPIFGKWVSIKDQIEGALYEMMDSMTC